MSAMHKMGLLCTQKHKGEKNVNGKYEISFYNTMKYAYKVLMVVLSAFINDFFLKLDICSINRCFVI